MAITSFYLLNMFPQMRTLHHHRTVNTQHPSQTCSLECALGIITQHSSPNTKTKHVPSDAHFASFGELFFLHESNWASVVK